MIGTVMRLTSGILGLAVLAAVSVPALALTGDTPPKARPVAAEAREEQRPPARPEGLLVRPKSTVSIWIISHQCNANSIHLILFEHSARTWMSFG